MRTIERTTAPTGPSRRVRPVAVLLAALAGVAACAVAPGDGTAARATPAQMQALLDRWRDRADAPAVVLAVDAGDRGTWVGASGTPLRDGREPVAPDAPFRVASITKTFVAVVVLQLAAEGRLSLDDTVSEHLPGGGAAADAYGHVTVRQLLGHTGGVPDYARVEGLGPELLAHRDRRWTATDVLGLVEDREPDFAPGTDYRYSNTGYVLLGEVVRGVTGRHWAHAVRTRILDPMHLDDTYVAGAEALPSPVLPGYVDADEDGDVENVERSRPWRSLETSEGAAGAIVSTGPDLMRFGDALFRGDLLRPAELREMTTPGAHHPRNRGYGLGLEFVRPDYRTTAWGHSGFMPGFRSTLWYVPSADVVVVALANDARADPADLAELAVRAGATGVG